MNAIGPWKHVSSAPRPFVRQSTMLGDSVRAALRPRAGIRVVTVGLTLLAPQALGASEASGATGPSAAAFPPVVALSDLLQANGGDGSEGFVVQGGAPNDNLGARSRGIGDLNGDGIDDVVTLASRENRAYVVFGSAGGFAPEISVNDLDGTNGFAVTASASLLPVGGGGDVNGDGTDDLFIGTADAGATYVIFGTDAGFPAEFNVSTLDGDNGFMAIGNFYAGYSVNDAGDVNGDGIDDLIIGETFSANQGYVIFGSTAGFPATLNLSTLDGSNGFSLTGGSFSAGTSADGLGDVNGDSIGDVVVGGGGSSYVVFGMPGAAPASVNLATLDGADGFVINAGGFANGAGDLDGDGLNDLVVATGPGFDYSGRTYVVFGSDAGFPASIDTQALDGSDGFTLVGSPYDYSGYSATAAGDINGDGIGDLTIGGNLGTKTWVVFGSDAGFPAQFPLSALDGENGFVASGANDSPAAAGDVNDDGIDDLITGNTGCCSQPGQTFVLFGRGAAQDSDGDGIADDADNCTLVPNADQRDTDADGFGNACDADLDDDCSVDVSDLAEMKVVFYTGDADADLNGDGIVNFLDLGLMKTAFFAPPGPSGVTNICD